MNCPRCGATVSVGALVCPRCGAIFTAAPGPYGQPQAVGYASQLSAPYPAMANPGVDDGAGEAIASLVLGLGGFFLPLVGSILALIMAHLAGNKGNRSGMLTAGRILGVIGLVLWTIAVVGGIAFFGWLMSRLM